MGWFIDPVVARAQEIMKESLKAAGAKAPVDQLVIQGRYENQEQAKAAGDAALEKANDDKTTGSLTIVGNQYVYAGMNINLEGFGRFNGKWRVKTVKHSIDRSSGYKTELEIYKVD